MWTRTYSVITRKIHKKQIWQLMADPAHWSDWDEGLEAVWMDGAFEKGNFFYLTPKGGPKLKVTLTEVEPEDFFEDKTALFLASLYDRHCYEETPKGLKITSTLRVCGLLSFFWVWVLARKMMASLPVDITRQIDAASKIIL